MFSRYKKPDFAAPGPLLPAAPETAPRTADPARAPVASQPAPPDKDRKRKERMGEIKVELHKRLLDNLNLAALDTATEQELRDEIEAISTEALNEMGTVLNREDCTKLHRDLYDEVTGLGPLEAGGAGHCPSTHQASIDGDRQARLCIESRNSKPAQNLVLQRNPVVE
jgi:pilus assembly protein CpaF